MPFWNIWVQEYNIATDIPGIREVIPNESKNYLFPYQNVEKLRSLLVEVISNVGLQKGLEPSTKIMLMHISPQKLCTQSIVTS